MLAPERTELLDFAIVAASPARAEIAPNADSKLLENSAGSFALKCFPWLFKAVCQRSSI